MPRQPRQDLGVLVGAVVVQDRVDQLAGRHRRLDGVEEAQELLVPVALHAAAEHRPVEHVERREQGRGAVALVVVGHGRAPARRTAFSHRQARLGRGRGLLVDLGLLVHREHDRVCRRSDVEADDVAQLGREPRVLAELEGPDLVRPEPVRAPDALHRAGADPDRLGHGGGRPVRRLVRRVAGRQLDHAVDHRLRQGRDARGPGLVAQEPGHALAHEPLLPAPDARLGHPGPAHDRARPAAVGRGQDDLRPPDVLLRAVPIRHHRLQTGTVGGGQLDGDPFAHPRNSGCRPPKKNSGRNPIH